MASEIGTIVEVDRSGDAASAPLRVDLITMVGDAEYPAGGTEGFQAAVRAIIGVAVTVIGVMGAHKEKLMPYYDQANDKLWFWDYNTDAENATGNLSGTTFTMMVISK
jgi:hypothetical protein